MLCYQCENSQDVVADHAEVESQDGNAGEESDESVVGDLVLQRQRLEEEVEKLRGKIARLPDDCAADVALKLRQALAVTLQGLGRPESQFPEQTVKKLENACIAIHKIHEFPVFY